MIPALIKRRGLSYPSTLLPGFDPKHPASSKLRYSGVASNAAFRGLGAGNPTPVFVGSGNFTSAMDGIIGPSLGCGSSVSNSNQMQVPGLGGTPTQATIACIARFSNFSTYNGIFGDSFSDDVCSLFVDATAKLMMRAGTTNTIASNLSMSVGVPYFCVASINQSSNINFLLLRLDNGEVQTQSVGGVNVTMAASTAAYLVGNWPFVSLGMTGNLATVMYNHAYLSIPQLLQWAQDPWGFWYPNSAELALFATPTSGGSVSVPGVGMTSGAGLFSKALQDGLAGASSSIAAGTLSPIIGTTVGLVGASSSVAAGSFSKALQDALAGASAVLAAASFAETVQDILAGAGATSAAGTLSVGGNATLGLASASSSIAAGSFSKALQDALAGASSSIAAGSLGKVVVIGVPGIGMVITAAGPDTTNIILTMPVGIVSGAGSFADAIVRALTGAAATSAAGTFSVSAGSNSNVNLPGAGMTAAPGVFVAAILDAMTGAGMSAGAGSFADAIADALVGAGITTAAGSFTPAVAVILAGAGMSMASGSFSISTGSSSSTTLNGAGMAAAAGSMVASIIKAMTGAAAAAAAGAFGAQDGVALTGAGATASAGTLGEAIATALSGAGAVITPGSFANAIAEVLAGAAASAAAGNFSIATGSGSTFQLPGASASAAAGSFADAESDALPGAGAAMSPGSFAPGGARLLSGAGATAAAGALAKAMAEALQGTALQTSAGSFGVAIGAQTVALVGVSVQIRAGTWTISIGTLVTGPNPLRTVGTSRRPVRIVTTQRTVATIH